MNAEREGVRGRERSGRDGGERQGGRERRTENSYGEDPILHSKAKTASALHMPPIRC